MEEGKILIEVESDSTARWFANSVNRNSLCERLGSNFIFVARTYSVIVFNAPLTIDIHDTSHSSEICEANNWDDETIKEMRWVKPIDRRTPNQRSAHLIMLFTDPIAANRAIAEGIWIFNKKCHIEKTRRKLVFESPVARL